MPDDLPGNEATGAIGGIEILHRLAPGIGLDALQVAWPNGAPTGPPVILEHAVGDVSVSSMRHVMDIGMRVSYYAPAAGGTAIRIRNLEADGPVHVLRVVEPGRRYSVCYEFQPRRPAYRRDVEITAFSHALTVRGDLLMAHGCGVVLPDGRGVIFLGPSGAGKSTAATMLDGLRGTVVLNDDRLVLERRGARFHLWATPWPGNAGVARSGDGPLAMIALIGRSDSRSAQRLTSRAALARVLPTLALPIWDPTLMESALKFVDALLEYVPVIDMRYPLGAGTPEWIIETLQGTNDERE